MKFMRRQFQIGPTRFELRRTTEGWLLVAVWWEINRHVEKESLEEVVAGPMSSGDAWFAVLDYQAETAAAEKRRRLRCA